MLISIEMKTKALIFVTVIVVAGCSGGTKNPGAAEDKTAKKAATEKTMRADSMLHHSSENENAQLISKHVLSPDDLYKDTEGGKELADYFVIELIDKKTFMDHHNLAADMLNTDTSAIQKVNGVISLPCRNKTVRFTDNLSDGEGHAEYTYVGDLEPLGLYLMSGIYWEEWGYFLVDKNKGNVVLTFQSQPIVSNDMKHIICIDMDTWEGYAYIDLYEIDNNHIQQMATIYSKKWIPIGSSPKDGIYWGKDNYLYVPVVHNADFWAAEGNYAGLDQYIRIKPTA